MALFSWKIVKKIRPDIGKVRVVRKLIIYKRLGDEVRVLGFERVVQEWQRWRDYCPEMLTPVTVIGWRDTAWA